MTAVVFRYKGRPVLRLGTSTITCNIQPPDRNINTQFLFPTEPPNTGKMKITSIAAFFTLMLGAVALPEHIAERDGGLEASKCTLYRTQTSENVRLQDRPTDIATPQEPVAPPAARRSPATRRATAS